MPYAYYSLLKVVTPDAPGFPEPGSRFRECGRIKTDRSIQHAVVHPVDRVEDDPLNIGRIMDKGAWLVTDNLAVLPGAIGASGTATLSV